MPKNQAQQRTKECPQCHGHGVWDIWTAPEGPACTKCKGSGRVPR